MITPYEEEKEKQDLFDSLSMAGIVSASNGGKGANISLTDFQIVYLRRLVKGDLEK